MKYLKHYSLAFRADGKTTGYYEMARTMGQAIDQALDRNDYELDNLIDIREVFHAIGDKQPLDR